MLRNLYRNTVDRYADYLKSSGVLEHATVAELSNISQIFEEIGDFETAIDACLRANPGSTGGARRGGSFVEEGDGGASPDELQEIWLNAVRLSLRCTGVNR